MQRNVQSPHGGAGSRGPSQLRTYRLRAIGRGGTPWHLGKVWPGRPARAQAPTGRRIQVDRCGVTIPNRPAGGGPAASESMPNTGHSCTLNFLRATDRARKRRGGWWGEGGKFRRHMPAAEARSARALQATARTDTHCIGSARRSGGPPLRQAGGPGVPWPRQDGAVCPGPRDRAGLCHGP